METTNCILNSSTLFYIVFIAIPVFILVAILITKAECKSIKSSTAQWVFRRLKKPFSYVNRWNKVLEILYTAQMTLTICSALQFRAIPEDYNGWDLLSVWFALLILTIYLGLLVGIVPAVLMKYLNLDVEDRKAEHFPHLQIVTDQLDLTKKMSFLHPFLFLIMRFGLSLLLLNYSGFAKSGYFHLMQFYFTLYLADRKPFRTKLKNIGELLNSIFLVVLTYLISITFASSSSKPESSYASGYTAACFVLLAVVANLCVIIREQIQSLI